MPARIVPSNGEAAAAPYWIEGEVCRLGNAADCDLVLPATPPHAATVYYRAGQYFVVNRGDRAVEVAGEPLLPAETALWQADQILLLAPRLALRLEVAADPAPEARGQKKSSGKASDNESEMFETEPPPKRRVWPIAVGMLFVVGAFVVAAPRSPDAETARVLPASAEFNRLTADLLWAAGKDETRLQQLCWILQEARRNERRGNAEAAVTAYGHVRDMLLTVAEQERRPLHQELYERALEFVKSRLRSLE
jgi:hypothetical protein